MKKVLSLVLVLVMVLAMATVAFADVAVGFAGYQCEDDVAVVEDDGQIAPGAKLYIPLVDAEGHKATTMKSAVDSRSVVMNLTAGQTMVSSYKLVEIGGNYYYEIATKKNYGVELNPLEGTLTFAIDGQAQPTVVAPINVNVGWPRVTLNGTGTQTAVTTNGTPVVVVGKNIEAAIFDLDSAYGEAQFETRMVTGSEKKYNLYTDGYVDTDLQIANDDVARIEAINFLGNPSFDLTGTLTVKTDLEYAYINNNGKLTAVDAKYYDAEDDEWNIPAKKLTSFIFAEDELVSVGGDDTTTTTPDTNNPGTGSSDVVGVAVALAVVSLTAAGAVAFKKVK